MRCLIVVALLTTCVGRRNHSIVPPWRNATWTPRCRCNATTPPKKKPQTLWSRVFGGRKQAAPPRKPKYALELSGGLRTFLVTWPALSCALVERNGGRGNWWLGLEAPYDASPCDAAVTRTRWQRVGGAGAAHGFVAAASLVRCIRKRTTTTGDEVLDAVQTVSADVRGRRGELGRVPRGAADRLPGT